MLAGGERVKGDDTWSTKRAIARKMTEQLKKLTPVEQVDMLEKLLETLDSMMVKALEIAYTTRERGEQP